VDENLINQEEDLYCASSPQSIYSEHVYHRLLSKLLKVMAVTDTESAVQQAYTELRKLYREVMEEAWLNQEQRDRFESELGRAQKKLSTINYTSTPVPPFGR
jgi:hypothetical protein